MENGEKAAETVVVGNYVEMEKDGKASDIKSKLSDMFWHGGSAYDAWFSCASNQVIAFSQMKMMNKFWFYYIFSLSAYDSDS